MAENTHSDKVFVTFLVLAFIFVATLAFTIFPRHGAPAPHAEAAGVSRS